jgi:hypothetical protein
MRGETTNLSDDRCELYAWHVRHDQNQGWIRDSKQALKADRLTNCAPRLRSGRSCLGEWLAALALGSIVQQSGHYFVFRPIVLDDDGRHRERVGHVGYEGAFAVLVFVQSRGADDAPPELLSVWQRSSLSLFGQ